LDGSEKVWVTDYAEDHFYSFELSSTEVCTYTIPGEGASDYLLIDGDSLWLGDYYNGRIISLDLTGSQYIYWDFPIAIWPEGMVLDDNSDLWWADLEQGELFRLDSDINQATRYAPPLTLNNPAFVTTMGDQVWYTDWEGRLGALQPDEVSGVTLDVDRFTLDIDPTCGSTSLVETMAVTTTVGIVDWAQNTYPSLVNSGGWSIYELPADNLPWGINSSDDYIWFVDNGRQVLGRTPIILEQYLYLPLLSR
jgi:hypothetical protein